MSAPFFKDIGKTANNILNDDYDFSRKLKIKTKTANGVTFTTEGAMASNKSIVGKLASSFKHSSGINVSKLQLTTQGRIIGEADIANALVDNLKISFKVEDGCHKSNAPSVGKLGAEYKQKQFTTNAEADFGNSAITGAGVVAYQNFVFGAAGAFSLEKSSITDNNIALAYNGPDFHVSLVTKKRLGFISTSFDHQPSKDTLYSAVFDYDLKSASNTLTVGGRFNADLQTTYCGKINSEGILSFSCIQKVRPFLSLTTSAQIDAKNFEGDSHRFGMGVTLG